MTQTKKKKTTTMAMATMARTRRTARIWRARAAMMMTRGSD
jgi:hypothetical protein